MKHEEHSKERESNGEGVEVHRVQGSLWELWVTHYVWVIMSGS